MQLDRGFSQPSVTRVQTISAAHGVFGRSHLSPPGALLAQTCSTVSLHGFGFSPHSATGRPGSALQGPGLGAPPHGLQGSAQGPGFGAPPPPPPHGLVSAPQGFGFAPHGLIPAHGFDSAAQGRGQQGFMLITRGGAIGGTAQHLVTVIDGPQGAGGPQAGAGVVGLPQSSATASVLSDVLNAHRHLSSFCWAFILFY